MNFCACSSTMVSSNSGTAAAAASSSFGGYWNRLPRLVVMVWKPAGSRAGGKAIELVEQSAVGRRQQFPGHGAQKWRRHERGRDQRADELPPGHIGARHQPSHRRRDNATDRRRCGGDDGGGKQWIEEIGIGEQRDEILQREVA